jgi:molybdate transport system substrate-binding protein
MMTTRRSMALYTAIRSRAVRSWSVPLAAAVLAACSARSPGKTVKVAAASDLTHALDEVARAFDARTGIEPVIDFNASGVLAKQIEEGAPFRLFLSASREYVDDVVAAGRCDRATAAMYSRGRLVVWTRGAAPKQLSELADPRYRRIAIASPEHAPYGRAAKQALEAAGLYAQLASKLVPAENVQQAMTYAREGSTDAAIVALSLAIGDGADHYLAVDPALYAPLEQELVVCGSADDTDAARQLAAFITTGAGREILTRYGFSVDATAAAQGSAS